MFYAGLERAEVQRVRADFDQGIYPFFEKIKKSELITSSRFVGNFEQRNGNGRRRRREMRNNLFVTDDLQDIAHSLGKLTERDDRFVGAQTQIERDAFRDVIGEPPARIASFVGGARDGGVQPIAIELEELA